VKNLFTQALPQVSPAADYNVLKGASAMLCLAMPSWAKDA